MTEATKISTTPLQHELLTNLIKTCPSCQSIYITDDECESCGLLFNRKSIQGLDEIKEFYIEQLSTLEKVFPKLEKRKSNEHRIKNYLIRLHSRAYFLIDQLMVSKDMNLKDYNIYFLEFKNILEQIANYTNDIDKIYSYCLDRTFRADKQIKNNFIEYIEHFRKGLKTPKKYDLDIIKIVIKMTLLTYALVVIFLIAVSFS